VGLCLYDTKETSSGLWMLIGNEEMPGKRDEEYIVVLKQSNTGFCGVLLLPDSQDKLIFPIFNALP
jgi:hypothetical protein